MSMHVPVKNTSRNNYAKDKELVNDLNYEGIKFFVSEKKIVKLNGKIKIRYFLL